MTEETQEDDAGVFADIVHALLFEGEQRVVLPGDLADTTIRSQFSSRRTTECSMSRRETWSSGGSMGRLSSRRWEKEQEDFS